MNCGVGHRHSSDLALLWLWSRPAAPILPLAWELPYATGAAPKKQKKKKKTFLLSPESGDKTEGMTQEEKPCPCLTRETPGRTKKLSHSSHHSPPPEDSEEDRHSPKVTQRVTGKQSPPSSSPGLLLPYLRMFVRKDKRSQGP